MVPVNEVLGTTICRELGDDLCAMTLSIRKSGRNPDTEGRTSESIYVCENCGRFSDGTWREKAGRWREEGS